MCSTIAEKEDKITKLETEKNELQTKQKKAKELFSTAKTQKEDLEKEVALPSCYLSHSIHPATSPTPYILLPLPLHTSCYLSHSIHPATSPTPYAYPSVFSAFALCPFLCVCLQPSSVCASFAVECACVMDVYAKTSASFSSHVRAGGVVYGVACGMCACDQLAEEKRRSTILDEQNRRLNKKLKVDDALMSR